MRAIFALVPAATTMPLLSSSPRLRSELFAKALSKRDMTGKQGDVSR